MPAFLLASEKLVVNQVAEGVDDDQQQGRGLAWRQIVKCDFMVFRVHQGGDVGFFPGAQHHNPHFPVVGRLDGLDQVCLVAVIHDHKQKVAGFAYGSDLTREGVVESIVTV